jgi:hypothetical protein
VDDVAAVDGEPAVDADADADAAEALVDGDDADVDFFELQPAASTRPTTVTVTRSLFSGRTVVLQFV